MKAQKLKTRESDKGQYEELIEFAKYIKGATHDPIPLWQMVQATSISFLLNKE